MAITKRWGENSNCDYTGVTEDTYIRENFPNFNYGITAAAYIGIQAASAKVLIKFDLTSLESLIQNKDQITSSKLFFYQQAPDINGSPKVYSHRIKVPWNAGTKNHTTAGSGEVCWNYRQYSNTTWHVDGARGSNDIDLTPTDNQIVDTRYEWYEWDVTDIIKYQFENNEYYGILLGMDYQDPNYCRPNLSEISTVDARPYLEITYNLETEKKGPLPMFFRP